MQADVSIVVVNWNTRDILRDCLHSIENETRTSHEIIVVDNASNDASASMVAKEFPDVALVVNDTNRGFAAANNQGIPNAKGRYVLLLNPDTIILDGAIDRMIEWCDARTDVGCAGCQVMETETKIQQTCFSDPSPMNTFLIETGLHRLFPRSTFFGHPAYSWWDRRSEKDVDVVSGMFMLIPRSVLDTVGLLDEAFFVYAEEADLCRRIRRAGFRCVFAPVARIVHLDGGSKSTSQISQQMHVQLQKSLLLYIKKHHGVAGVALTRTILITSNFVRWVLFGLIALLSGSAELQARAHLARISLAYLVLGDGPKS